jgi:hypothetical protein
MSDVADALTALRDTLIKNANNAGEGPETMRKSKFVSQMERDSFIQAYGQKAYDRLKD